MNPTALRSAPPLSKISKVVDTHFSGPECEDAWLGFMPSAAVMVTCIDPSGRPNIIPLTGWGVLCRFPFVIGIAICQGSYTKNYFPRYSHNLLEEVPEFVLNIPHTGLRDAITICGSSSGDQVDKFKAAGLTPLPSLVVRPPGIAECVTNYECRIVNKVSLGSHDVYMGETVAVHSAAVNQCTDEDLITFDLMAQPGSAQPNAGRMSFRSLPLFQPLDAPADCQGQEQSTFIRA
jgi:flavin reductase (DIM6/NTAB) family NADH-FMN oxidoreductase RutF